jgi:hypothetical protein
MQLVDELQELAQEKEVPILATTQFSREQTKKGQKAGLEHMAEFKERVYGIIPAAIEQARVAAEGFSRRELFWRVVLPQPAWRSVGLHHDVKGISAAVDQQKNVLFAKLAQTGRRSSGEHTSGSGSGRPH